MRFRETVLIIFATGLAVAVALLVWLNRAENRRVEAEQARNEALAHELTATRRSLEETLKQLSDECKASAEAATSLAASEDRLKRAHASFLRQLAEGGKQREEITKQLAEYRMHLQIERDKSAELDLKLTDKRYEVIALEEELEGTSKRLDEVQGILMDLRAYLPPGPL